MCCKIEHFQCIPNNIPNPDYFLLVQYIYIRPPVPSHHILHVSFTFQMASSCGLDSGLCVVLIILSALLLAVAILLFYDFENVCENSNANNLTNMVCICCVELMVEFN